MVYADLFWGEFGHVAAAVEEAFFDGFSVRGLVSAEFSEVAGWKVDVGGVHGGFLGLWGKSKRYQFCGLLARLGGFVSRVTLCCAWGIPGSYVRRVLWQMKWIRTSF